MGANNTVNQVVATSVNCCGMRGRQADKTPAVVNFLESAT